MNDLVTGTDSHRRNILIILAISILLATPLFSRGFFTAHDIHCHMFKTVATVEALLDGQLPPLVGPSLANGFGYAWNIFYAPLSAYIPAFLKIFIPTFIDSMKLFIFLTLFLSGITMYCFALDISRSSRIAFLAAAFYLTAPYRLEDIYIRGAMGEALAFVFFPVFFQGLYSLFYQEGQRDYLIALGLAGLILSHNISALMAGTAACFYLAGHWKQLFQPRVIKSLAGSGLAVLALSLFYLGPLLEHRFWGDYAVFLPDGMGSLASMEAQRLTLQQLFFDEFAPGKLSFNLGLQFLIPLVFLPWVWKQILKNKNLFLFHLLGLGSVLVMTKAFPWTVMPGIFAFIQFPWRFLALAVFFFSLACASLIALASEKLEAKTIVLVVLAVFLYISPVLTYAVNDPKISDQNFRRLDRIVEESAYSQGSAFFEYMPVKAKADIPYLAKRENKALIIKGGGEISKEVKKGTNLSFEVQTSVPTLIELPYLYYLGWEAVLEPEQGQGKYKLKVLESAKGFAALELPAQVKGTVSVKFQGTLLTRLAYLVSLLSLPVFLLARVKNRQQNKKYK
jgi:uncharacterized membrane protein